MILNFYLIILKMSILISVCVDVINPVASTKFKVTLELDKIRQRATSSYFDIYYYVAIICGRKN